MSNKVNRAQRRRLFLSSFIGFTIIFILLVAGKAFGVVGVVLGIPGYAVIKVIATEFFQWYQKFIGGYEATQPADKGNQGVEKNEEN